MFRRIKDTIGMMLAAVTLLYGALLCCLLIVLERVGETHWLCSVLLFVPGFVWLLPVAVLALCSLVLRPILLLPQALCVFLVYGVYLNPKWMPRADATGESITILTNNVGEHHGTLLDDLVKRESPDLIAIQEASEVGRDYARRFPMYRNSFVGQHVLLSRHPILNAQLITIPIADRPQPVAARFVVSVRGRPLVIYSVHLPTPRPDFRLLSATSVLAQLPSVDVNDLSGAVHNYRRAVTRRISTCKRLIQLLQAETEPVVAAGDFNVPSHGYLYRALSTAMRDAFAERGRGYGWNFPGDDDNPFQVGIGPWMRIDYLFCRGSVRWSDCYAEANRPSQHRAVIAKLELR